jgi:hypothetical protein
MKIFLDSPDFIKPCSTWEILGRREDISQLECRENGPHSTKSNRYPRNERIVNTLPIMHQQSGFHVEEDCLIPI